MTRFSWGVWVLAVCMALGGCRERTNLEIMESARSHLAQQNVQAATIELRALLQRKPQAGEARFLLGKVLFDAGDWAAAEEQLRFALQYGYPDDEVVPLLAQVLTSLNRSMALLTEFQQTEFADRVATADLKLHVAAALLFDRKVVEAAQAVARALELVPDHANALVMRARLRAVQGDTADARQQVDALLARVPDNAAGWALRGDLLMSGDTPEVGPAIEAHRRALSLRPGLVQSQAAVLSMLIAAGDLDGATAQWTALKKALPKHPQTFFFEAVLALRKGDALRAQTVAEPLLAGSPNDLRLLLLAGQAAMQLGSLELAESLLVRGVKVAEAAPLPRHLLAEVYLRTGRAERALEVLDRLLRPEAGDAVALALAGRAHLIVGNLAAADASFAQALKIRPGDKVIRTTAALARLGRSQSEAVFAELEAIAKSDAGTTTDLALASARIGRREFAAALKAIDALAAKVPEQALPEHLRGQIALANNDTAAARKHFEKALVFEPAYFPATAQLVALDVAAGDAAAARARLQAVRQREPGNSQVRLALATLTRQTGGSPAEVTALLEEAVKAQPADAALHAALIDEHVAQGGLDRALAAAQAAVVAVPRNLTLVDRFGRVQLTRGDVQQALSTFNEAKQAFPQAALPYQRLAETNLVIGKLDSASDLIRLALKLSPRSIEVQRVAIAVALRQKRNGDALALVRKVQEQRPDQAVGFALEGEVGLTMRKYDVAAAAFRKAIALAPSTEAAKHLHMALLGTRNVAETDRWAEAWLSKHPDDTAFIVHLADTALGSGDLEQAERRYRQVLERLPGNALAMNNVAYVMVKMKKAGALPLAEKAAALAPREAVVLDTLATAYAEERQLDKAIEWQIKAIELAPNGAGLRLNLARFYIQANERDRALTQLDRLALMGKSFEGYVEVAQLRKKLGP